MELSGDHVRPSHKLSTIMRTTILLLSLLFVVPAAFGQIIRPDTTSNWRKHLSIGVNFNQAAFSSNWKAGGINSVGLNEIGRASCRERVKVSVVGVAVRERT